MNNTRAELHALFTDLCARLNITPLPGFHIAAHMAHATFATEAEASTISTALRAAGEVVQPLHRWDPATDPDFDREEWQVSWGDLSSTAT